MKFDDLCFFICWYNDIGIIQTLHYLPEQSHKIVIDGKFKYYDAPTPLSTSYLRDKVKRYPNVTLIDAPNLLEHEKRNIYLKECKQKIGFVIDSDEYIIVSDWPKVFAQLENADTADLRGVFITHHTIPNRHDIPPRIIINPNDWEYYKAHWIFRNRITGEIPQVTDEKSLKFFESDIIKLEHSHKLRTKDEMIRHDDYNKILREYEAPVLEAYQLTEL